MTTEERASAGIDPDDEGLGLGTPGEIQRLRERVVAMLRIDLRDAALAEDICNEAFRVTIERLRQQPLDDPGRVVPYLVRTAQQLARDDRQKRIRQRTDTGAQEAIELLPASQPEPGASIQRRYRAEAVRRVLEEMPVLRDREILVRHYLYDQDKEQVCRELDITEEHFRRVLHRARGRFRDLLLRRYRLRDLYCLGVF